MSAIRYSVIVATYNRPAKLAVCLGALLRLDYPRDAYEVIVVDDGSPAPLDAVVAEAQSARPNGPRLRLIRQANAGAAAARNAGARIAEGEFIAFTDDDCEVLPDWLHAFDAARQRHPDALLGGAAINGLPDNLFSSASHWIHLLVYAFYNRDPDNARFFATQNMSMLAARFRELGGLFAPYRSAAEDRDLCHRWIQTGGRLVYVPEARMIHRHDLTLASFWRQHFAYGRGAYRFHALCEARGSGSLRDHLPFHRSLPSLSRSLGLPAAQIPVLVLWQVANAAGYFWEMLLGNRQASSAGN
jgi:GT2 family glycosyltransferase